MTMVVMSGEDDDDACQMMMMMMKERWEERRRGRRKGGWRCPKNNKNPTRKMWGITMMMMRGNDFYPRVKPLRFPQPAVREIRAAVRSNFFGPVLVRWGQDVGVSSWSSCARHEVNTDCGSGFSSCSQGRRNQWQEAKQYVRNTDQTKPTRLPYRQDT